MSKSAAVKDLDARTFTVRAPSPEVADKLKKALARLTELSHQDRDAARQAELDAKTELYFSLYGAKLNVQDEQIERNALERQQFASEYPLWDAGHVARFMRSAGAHRAALANKLKARGKIFSVRIPPDNRDYYPAFQFDPDTRKPWPAIAEVLRLLAGKRRGWELAFWFVTENGWLEGDARPVELLATDPEAIVEAARREAEEPLD